MAAFGNIFKLQNKLFHYVPIKSVGHIFKGHFSTTVIRAEKVDVVISGGGMVGAAMACALAQNEMYQNKKIVLLEAASDKGEFILPESYSNRTCSLSTATVNLLESIGAWDEIKNMRYQPVKRMQVWESCSDALITFNNEDLCDDLAYIVENDVILGAIMKRLKATGDNVDIMFNTKAKNYRFPGEKDENDHKEPIVSLELSNGQSLQTDLLIGADGFQSAIRKKANFHTIHTDYKQCAVVATLQLAETVDNTVAWQRFLKTGPIALLPLGPNLSSMVWSTTAENAKNLKQIPEDSFVDAVNDALWHDRDKNPVVSSVFNSFTDILNNILPGSLSSKQLPPTVIGVQENSRAAFPLSLTHSSNYVKSRVVLIGDAAHRIHPLAGQGVNLGFGDVTCLNELLRNCAKHGGDPGSLTHLLDYETQRQRQIVPVMVTIDGLQRLYSTSLTPVVLLRSLGLHTVHSLDIIKNQIIKQASS